MPDGLTGRATTWTVSDVGSVPTLGKSIFSLISMYDEHLHLLLHVYI